MVSTQFLSKMKVYCKYSMLLVMKMALISTHLNSVNYNLSKNYLFSSMIAYLCGTHVKKFYKQALQFSVYGIQLDLISVEFVWFFFVAMW